MTAVARLVTRSFLAVCALSITLMPPPSHGEAKATSTGESASVSNSEVRLRKLHLVRPDLIPYPIAYEVCC
jgi:hypothetical protein